VHLEAQAGCKRLKGRESDEKDRHEGRELKMSCVEIRASSEAKEGGSGAFSDSDGRSVLPAGGRAGGVERNWQRRKTGQKPVF
jgi:hypothetical protein